MSRNLSRRRIPQLLSRKQLEYNLVKELLSALKSHFETCEIPFDYEDSIYQGHNEARLKIDDHIFLLNLTHLGKAL